MHLRVSATSVCEERSESRLRSELLTFMFKSPKFIEKEMLFVGVLLGGEDSVSSICVAEISSTFVLFFEGSDDKLRRSFTGNTLSKSILELELTDVTLLFVSSALMDKR